MLEVLPIECVKPTHTARDLLDELDSQTFLSYHVVFVLVSWRYFA